MKRRYWAVRVLGEDGEWWLHRNDVSDFYISPDTFVTRDEARALKKSAIPNAGDKIEVVELAIIRSTGN
jgi:hypothetical protein